MNKIYIASPFFNEFQLMIVERIENMLANYSLDFHSPRSVGVIKSMSAEEKRANTLRIYNDNIEKMEECNTMICFVDDKDTGTLFELGFAMCLKRWSSHNLLGDRKVITFSEAGKPINVMLAHGVDGHAASWDELAELMTCLKNGTALISKTAEISE